jgi:predicted glycoside hydrolase/deacetylase ChbG (UPF0249 family)
LNSASKKLIVNADDFGFTRDVNAGIVHAHRHGIVTATTLMANGHAFADAVRLADETPSLDIGCHLVLIQGRSLVNGELLPTKWSELLERLIRRKIDPYSELRAQLEKIFQSGIRPTHLDTHKHTHVLPPVLSAVAKLAEEFDVPYLRMPFDADWRAVHWLSARYRARLQSAGVRSTDHFLGFRLTDSLNESNLMATLLKVSAGCTELMCHPGYLREELRQAATRLKEKRQVELQALTSARVRASIDQLGIELTTYRGMAEAA